jgi:hypothetical protein
MPFLTGVVGIEDSSGDRIDVPDSTGTHQPIMLRLGSAMTGTAVATGSVTEVTLNSVAGALPVHYLTTTDDKPTDVVLYTFMNSLHTGVGVSIRMVVSCSAVPGDICLVSTLGNAVYTGTFTYVYVLDNFTGGGSYTATFVSYNHTIIARFVGHSAVTVKWAYTVEIVESQSGPWEYVP